MFLLSSTDPLPFEPEYGFRSGYCCCWGVVSAIVLDKETWLGFGSLFAAGAFGLGSVQTTSKTQIVCSSSVCRISDEFWALGCDGGLSVVCVSCAFQVVWNLLLILSLRITFF